MRFRFAVVLALAIAAVCGVASCSNGASTSNGSGTIPLVRAGAPTTYSSLDPYKTVGCNALYCALFMEHLLNFGPTGKLEPLLATSWEQTSPVTYVYHLRHGVKFFDGNEMTSADVAFSLNYDRAPGSKTEFAFSSVKSVESTDKYTVLVTLSRPDAAWKYAPSYEGPIFEKSFQEAHPTTMGNPDVLIQATGPWKVDSFDPTRGIELSANPNWWDGKAPVQHISYKFFSGEKSEALAMRAGEIDVSFPQDGRTFAATSGAKVMSYANNNIAYLGMNTKLAPWSDIHVRRAVAYAINRADIITAYGGPGSGTPAYAMIPAFELKPLGSESEVNAMLNSLPQYRFDLAKAKQEMAQSAFPHGFSASLDTYDNGSFPNIVQVIAAQLQQIGITLTVNTVPVAKWSAEITGPKTYGPMFSTIYDVPPDPSGRLTGMFGSVNGDAAPYNFANYTSPAIDELLNSGLAASDSPQRLAIYGQLMKNAADDLPYVPLFQTKAYTALSSKFALRPMNIWPAFIPWALDIKRAG